jgi:hypothetical protein
MPRTRATPELGAAIKGLYKAPTGGVLGKSGHAVTGRPGDAAEEWWW